LPQESQAGKQEVLRRASLRWMQVGIRQYERSQFADAELSFRRARVFQKYLDDAERRQLDEYLANARIVISEGTQALAITQTADESVEQDQPVKAEANVEKVKAGRPPLEEGRRQTTEVIDKISEQPSRREKSPVEATEAAVSKIQVRKESSRVISLAADGSLSSKLMGLSSWLSENRGNILMICLPVLAVLIFISKQAARKRPGGRVYTNQVPQNSSFIGSKLNGGNENRRPVKNSKNARSPSAAAENPKRKSFTQSTDHWKKDPAGLTPAARKSFKTNDKTPQRKDKFEDENPALTKDQKKLCRKCNELKPLGDFHKDKSCKDGLARWCKECRQDGAKNVKPKLRGRVEKSGPPRRNNIHFRRIQNTVRSTKIPS